MGERPSPRQLHSGISFSPLDKTATYISARGLPGDEEPRRLAQEAGFDSLLTKPVKLHILLTDVQEALAPGEAKEPD